MQLAKTSLIIPALYANEELEAMTSACVSSMADEQPDELLVVEDVEGAGYSSTVNCGLELATGDVLIISNNDITFRPGWLTGLLKPLQAGCDISSIKTNEQSTDTHDTITDGDRFGSIWAMTRHAYETLGPLDESFGRGYFEDLDYWKRAQEAGLRVGKYHGVYVMHKAHTTFRLVDPDDKAYQFAEERWRQKWGQVL